MVLLHIIENLPRHEMPMLIAISASHSVLAKQRLLPAPAYLLHQRHARVSCAWEARILTRAMGVAHSVGKLQVPAHCTCVAKMCAVLSSEA